jgi:hypothetical protein
MVSSSSWLKSRLIRHHSTFSENRLNRSRESDILRRVAHAPERLHEEITPTTTTTRAEVEAHRKAFIRKWRLKHRAVADSLEAAGERLFTSFSIFQVLRRPTVELDAADLSVRQGRQMPPLTTCPLQHSLAGDISRVFRDLLIEN